MNRWLLGASVFLSVGCGDDDTAADASLAAPPVYPVPGCEAIDHRACDIEGSACRERLMDLAACLRGSERLPVPPVTTMTTAEYAAIVNARLAENPPPNPNHYEASLALLRLVVPGELSQAEIAPDDVTLLGVYRFEEKDILIIDHDDDDDDDEIRSNAVLIHEFVHALQDRDVDLAATREEFATSYDSYLALASVVEGEARMHETRFIASLLGLDPATIDWNERFQSSVELGEEALMSDSSVYSSSWGYFPYSLGARFVHHVALREGPEGVFELLRSPPLHTRAVMDSVIDAVVDDWPEPAFTAPEPPAPFTLWGVETLGAWGVYLALTRVATPEDAHPIALDWRGDYLLMYADDTEPGRTTIAWQIEFENISAATQFETMARSFSARVMRNETRVVWAMSTGADPIDWALVL